MSIKLFPVAPIEETTIGYRIPGIAFVDAGPVRSMNEAREFAERIARDQVSYLATMAELRIEGIRDLRGLCRPGAPDDLTPDDHTAA